MARTEKACRRVVIKATDRFVIAGNQDGDVLDTRDTYNRWDVTDTNYAKASRVV